MAFNRGDIVFFIFDTYHEKHPRLFRVTTTLEGGMVEMHYLTSPENYTYTTRPEFLRLVNDLSELECAIYGIKYENTK